MLFLLASLSARAEDIVVTSALEGAAISVNGVETGAVTPATVKAPFGRVQVSIERGCQRGEAIVDVPRGGVARVSVFAQEASGWLVVNVMPEDATLELDGRPYTGVPGVPVEVSCGNHSLRATREGHIPAIVTLDAGGGREDVANIALVPLAAGALEVSVTPREATIWVDDRPIGVGAISLPTLYEGMHTVGARLEGYAEASTSFEVKGGERLVYGVSLARGRGRSEVSLVDRSVLGGPPVAAAPSPKDAARADAPAAAAPRKDAPARAGRGAATAAPKAPTAAPKTPATSASEAPSRVLPLALLGGAGASGAFTGWAWYHTSVAYSAYQTRVDAAGSDEDRLGEADRFYDLNVVPRSRLIWIGAAGTLVLAGAGGLSLALEGGDVGFVPVAGGAGLSWQGRW